MKHLSIVIIAIVSLYISSCNKEEPEPQGKIYTVDFYAYEGWNGTSVTDLRVEIVNNDEGTIDNSGGVLPIIVSGVNYEQQMQNLTGVRKTFNSTTSYTINVYRNSTGDLVATNIVQWFDENDGTYWIESEMIPEAGISDADASPHFYLGNFHYIISINQ